MTTFLYIVWLLIPLFFFLTGLWAYLEELSSKDKRRNSSDLFRQALFVFLCVLVCIIIDIYLLPMLGPEVLPEIVPFDFLRVILLPLVLLAAAKIIGPSKEIQISKAPRPTEIKKKKSSK